MMSRYQVSARRLLVHPCEMSRELIALTAVVMEGHLYQ
jgi:hypothetical protein